MARTVRVVVDAGLAQLTVSDLDRAREWCGRVFGRPADRAPMDGLLEWQFTPQFGVQVWADAERSGRSTVVLFVPDLDAEAGRLAAAGIAHDGPAPGGGGRVLPLTDPDGNRVVLVGA